MIVFSLIMFNIVNQIKQYRNWNLNYYLNYYYFINIIYKEDIIH